jgi:hypothetical protein
MMPAARPAVAMPVAMPTQAPIRPEDFRPAPLFDREMPPRHEEE